MNLDDITIRNQLQPGDIGYVIYLHGMLYSREFGYGIDFEAYVAKGFYEFYQNYEEGKDCVWICEHNQKMVGCLVLMKRGEAAQLRYFIIRPEYRGIGLGKKLMNLYLDFLKEAGYKSAYLLTSPDLGAATHLYKKYGFRLVEEVKSKNFHKPGILQKYELKLPGRHDG